MSSIIGLHIERPDRPDWLLDVLRQAGPAMPYQTWIVHGGETLPRYEGQTNIARPWIGGDTVEHHLIRQGRAGGVAYAERVLDIARTVGEADYWLGPNEPPVEMPEHRQNLVSFYLGFADKLHSAGIEIGGPCDGVGRIGSGDPYLDATYPDWRDRVGEAALDLKSLYAVVDIIMTHAYLKRAGADYEEVDGWLQRSKFIVTAIPALSHLPWVATETGLDIGGGLNDGWLGPGGPDPLRYIEIIRDINWLLPEWFVGACLFGCLPYQRWAKWELSEEFCRRYLLPFVATNPLRQGSPAPTDPVIQHEPFALEDWHDDHKGPMNVREFAMWLKTVEPVAPVRELWLHHTATEAVPWSRDTIFNVRDYYNRLLWTDAAGRQHRGWTAGPHLFIGDEGIWPFSLMDRAGVHARGHNTDEARGIEMIGTFDDAPPSPDTWRNTMAALAVMCNVWGLDPEEAIHFHRDDSDKTCPGKAVHKLDVIYAVREIMRDDPLVGGMSLPTPTTEGMTTVHERVRAVRWYLEELVRWQERLLEHPSNSDDIINRQRAYVLHLIDIAYLLEDDTREEA